MLLTLGGQFLGAYALCLSIITCFVQCFSSPNKKWIHQNVVLAVMLNFKDVFSNWVKVARCWRVEAIQNSNAILLKTTHMWKGFRCPKSAIYVVTCWRFPGFKLLTAEDVILRTIRDGVHLHFQCNSSHQALPTSTVLTVSLLLWMSFSYFLRKGFHLCKCIHSATFLSL